MKALKTTLALLLLVLAALSAPGQARAGVSCHNINAKGTGQDHGDGTTEASIIGGGLLHGTTAASFVPTGLSGTVLSFTGTIVFTVNNATLTADIVGTFDLATGAFSATSTSVAGTGKLAGATGSLRFDGVENLSDGSFTEDVTGEICVELAP